MASYDKVVKIAIERYPTYEDDGTMIVSYGIPNIEFITCGKEYSLMGYSDLDELFADLKSVVKQVWKTKQTKKK